MNPTASRVLLNHWHMINLSSSPKDSRLIRYAPLKTSTKATLTVSEGYSGRPVEVQADDC